MVICLNEFIAVGVAAVKRPPPYWRFYFHLFFFRSVSPFRILWYHTQALQFGPRQAKNMSLSMRKMRGFRSSCACSKYNSGLCSLFIHYIVSIDSINGQ